MSVVRDEDACSEWLAAATQRTPAIPFFDICAVTFYPFAEVVQQPQTDKPSEEARCNIDIGGPSMVAAAAKNWHSVAVITNPAQYAAILEEIDTFGGIRAQTRNEMSIAANNALARYRAEIAKHFASLDFATIADDIAWSGRP